MINNTLFYSVFSITEITLRNNGRREDKDPEGALYFAISRLFITVMSQISKRLPMLYILLQHIVPLHVYIYRCIQSVEPKY